MTSSLISRNATLVGRAATLTTLVAALLAPAAASAQTITRGPYLQKPTTTSIVVRWRTDTASDSRVEWGAAAGSLGNVASDATVTTEHSIAVTGLSPGTTYTYAVGTTTTRLGGDDTDHRFTTLPTPGTRQPIRIWTYGDSGYANAAHTATRDAYFAYSGANPSDATDVWLMLGDNAYFLANDVNYQTAVFDFYEDFMRREVLWSVLGNHEFYGGNTSATQTGPYFSMFDFPSARESGTNGVASGTEAYYSFDYGNIHFVILDSMDSSRAVGSAMLTWLEQDLTATTADWTIAAWHHPPYSKGQYHDSDTEVNEIEMRANVVPLLEDYGVDLVVSGHSHSYERTPLIDGHAGLSDTLDASMLLDTGSGAPDTDGAYRKADTGQAPNQGAVFVVAGSAADARPFIPVEGHRLMASKLVSYGTMVLEVDGDTLEGHFLGHEGDILDSFRIEKGTARCPASPPSGCLASGKSGLVAKQGANDASDSLTYRWTGAELPAADVGDPSAESDLGLCVWDASGLLVDSALPPDAVATYEVAALATKLWVTDPEKPGLFLYKETTGAADGLRFAKVQTGAKGLMLVRGKGTALALPTSPWTLPVTAQIVARDTGVCFESVFAEAKKNDSTKFIAKATAD